MAAKLESPVDLSVNDNIEVVEREEAQPNELLDEAYSVFTTRQKRLIVIAASLGSFFSIFSSFIYYPALNTIAKDLHVSGGLINLSLTTYLIFQGISPMLVASFADTAGRRPAYIICFVTYIASNIGLGLQNNYVALLVLRCFQSAGVSATTSVANGIVGDLVVSSERGSYIAYTSLNTILGPSIAPLIGGLISQYLGWHWIFWILAILSGAYFVPFLIFFPETCRNIVGDGSLPPTPIARSLMHILRGRRKTSVKTYDTAKLAALRKDNKLRFPNPWKSLSILGDKAGGLILFSNSLIYACFCLVLASMPSLFARQYGFNDLKISLVYLPFSLGSIVSAFTTGKALDWNFARHAKRLGIPIAKNRRADLTNYPIERARLEAAVPGFFLGMVCMIAYGWAMDKKAPVAVPLVLLFFMAYALLAAAQTMGLIMLDYFPHKPASASAANFFARCLFGAGASAVVDPMINAMGVGWAITLAALVWMAYSPVLLLLVKYGPRWRKEKAERRKETAHKGSTEEQVSGTVDSVDRRAAQGNEPKDDIRPECNDETV